MKKVAFLSSKVTLPGSPSRRDDAFEHDLMISCLEKPLKTRGIQLAAVDWAGEKEDWSEYDGAVIGTTWDYWDYPTEFLSTLEKIEAAGTQLFNPARLVKWNSRKTYLRELSEKDVPTIPTLWLSHPTSSDLASAFDALECDDIVVKRQIGAGASDQLRLKRGEDASDYPFDAMVQPFMPSIQEEGEYSFVVIGGQISHVLIKRAKKGDYRIQSLFGGIEEKVEPSLAEQQTALDVVKMIDQTPLYARVDMIRGADGNLVLMELELIEPYLYPEQGPQLGELYAEALAERLG